MMHLLQMKAKAERVKEDKATTPKFPGKWSVTHSTQEHSLNDWELIQHIGFTSEAEFKHTQTKCLNVMRFERNIML